MVRSFAGRTLDEPLIMGVVNVTPDSFSDGGDHFDHEAAIAHGRRLIAEGAAIIDIGGESTRPNAEPVPVEEELRRVIPVIQALAGAGALVSIDSRHADVMAAAIGAGARIINDVTALTGDRRALPLAVETGVSVILMHMQGEPRTMQRDPRYDDAAAEVFSWLDARVAACRAAGLPEERIAIDPGIGFGKSVDHNVDILSRLSLYRDQRCALVVGVSRKSMIARLSRDEPPKMRLPGSLAAGLAAIDDGADILRVHDVAETVQAVAVWRAITAGDRGSAARAQFS
ncbi:MAG: dihydropteroate synthase [Defluviicoccus sp.]